MFKKFKKKKKKAEKKKKLFKINLTSIVGVLRFNIVQPYIIFSLVL
jgi:hypothetical protein